MTSFGWKRKAGAKVSKHLKEAFSSDVKDEDSDGDDIFDWLTMAKRKNVISLEDSNAKSQRLKAEGATLAEAERYWEAMQKWEEALQLSPSNYQVLDMKAQALMAVGEVFPAVQTAEKTVRIAPTWWPGHQTLGRALANVGEVRMALKRFSRAIHLNPGEAELWTEDLAWARSLLEQNQRLLQQQQEQEQAGPALLRTRSTCTVRELKEKHCNGSDDDDEEDVQPVVQYSGTSCENDENGGAGGDGSVRQTHKRMRRLPKNYVQMRDGT